MTMTPAASAGWQGDDVLAMSEILVFVNERSTSVSRQASVLDAVAVTDPDAATAIRAGRAYVTDGVGRPIDASGTIEAGSIVRVVRAAPQRRTPEPNA